MKYADIPEGEWDTLCAHMKADGLPSICKRHREAMAKYPTLSKYLMSRPKGTGIIGAYSVRYYLYSVISSKAQTKLLNFWDVASLFQCSENKFTKGEISFILDLLKQEDLRLHKLRRRRILQRKKGIDNEILRYT